jgi:predicted transcriptional regulator
MSKTQSSSAAGGTADADGAGAETFSRDALLEMLSNQRRRFVIHALTQTDGQMSVSELAERVASWEYDKPIERLDHRERKRVRNALRQFHLSKMADYGFIEFDAQRGVVSLSDEAAQKNFYVDSLTGGDVPWGVYYLALSVLALVAVSGTFFGVPPFSWVSPGAAALFLAVALLVSAVGHCYDNYYRMRLGARERPAEVRDQ